MSKRKKREGPETTKVEPEDNQQGFPPLEWTYEPAPTPGPQHKTRLILAIVCGLIWLAVLGWLVLDSN